MWPFRKRARRYKVRIYKGGKLVAVRHSLLASRAYFLRDELLHGLKADRGLVERDMT